MAETKLYNPLDYENLTKNLVRELMDREPEPMPPKRKFNGPGVYALFYDGSFKPYARLCSPDATEPIYVGKAVPTGARKGKRSTGPGSELLQRLGEHAESIEQAENLGLYEFKCRYLTVVPLWITMAERFLIEHYTPAWNVCIEGFGLHDPGGGRREGEVSWWDTLHPGRRWAKKQKKVKPLKDALTRLAAFLEERAD